MNCEDFNEIINELADYKPMAVSTREAGVSHIALCADCAARLANARATSATLLLAAGAESEDAPPRTKENLLAAFAARQQAVQNPNQVVHISSRRKLAWWVGAAAAVAAAAVTVMAVILPFWRGGLAPVTQVPEIAKKTSSGVVPTATPDHVPTPAPVSAPESTDKDRGGPGKQRPIRKTNRRLVNSGDIETVAQNKSTEFLPLTYLASATAMDSGTVVRVQLSKSALVRLGLPVNIESSNDSIRADLVIGDDGVARAIRLVD